MLHEWESEALDPLSPNSDENEISLYKYKMS